MDYDHKRSDERIRRLMTGCGMPNSTSLYQAFKQLEMEVRLEAEQKFPPQDHGASPGASESTGLGSSEPAGAPPIQRGWPHEPQEKPEGWEPWPNSYNPNNTRNLG